MNLITVLLGLGTALFFLLLSFIAGVFFEKKNHVKVDATIATVQADLEKTKAEIETLKTAAAAVKAVV